VRYEAGELVARAGGGGSTAYLVTEGELLLVAGATPLPPSNRLDLAALPPACVTARLAPGEMTREAAVGTGGSLEVHLVAGASGAGVVAVTTAEVEALLGRPLGRRRPAPVARREQPPLSFRDLEFHRVVRACCTWRLLCACGPEPGTGGMHGGATLGAPQKRAQGLVLAWQCAAAAGGHWAVWAGPSGEAHPQRRGVCAQGGQPERGHPAGAA
jgi:hypothetical protein